jgi:hypothetical protein
MFGNSTHASGEFRLTVPPGIGLLVAVSFNSLRPVMVTIVLVSA